MWNNIFYGFLIWATNVVVNGIECFFPRIPHDRSRLFEPPRVMGEIIITKAPPPSIGGNTKELRRLWIGCKIEGFLMSHGVFHAKDWDTCMKALLSRHGEGAKHYVDFWEGFRRNCSEDLTLEFKGCFEFKRKSFLHGSFGFFKGIVRF